MEQSPRPNLFILNPLEMNPRYMKVIRDLTSNYPKNLMLVLAIAVGVFGIGSIHGGYTVINREMAANYLSTEPASATIEFEGKISDQLLDSVREFPRSEEHTTELQS